MLKKLIDELNIANKDQQIPINFNVAPTQAVAAIISKQEERILSFYRWGLIPSWAAEVPKFQMINIRSESILEKPTFRTGLFRRRCIIPANGFYEWRKSDKQPFFIHPKVGELFYMAGIYDIWTGADGSFVPSLGIITTRPNTTMVALHDRMPVLLGFEDTKTWLHATYTDANGLKSLLAPCPDEAIGYYPVSKAVNKVTENSELCMQEMVQQSELI